MAKIIDLFNGKTLQKGETPSPVVAPQRFTLNATPGEITQEDIIASKDHDFRNDWRVTLAADKKLKLNIKEVKKHEVTLSDIGKAIAISSILKNDQDAVGYFTALSTQMATTQQYYLELGSIPDSFKGYVWSLNFQTIINAAAFAEYQLGFIIGKPITRHIYF